MYRTLVPLALAIVVLPATAGGITKCSGTRTATWSDGDCPTIKADAPPGGGRQESGSAPVDAPLAIVETGIPVMVQMPGRFAWLDDDTLAITTYGDPKAKVPWMVRKVVSFDLRTNAVATLVPRGFVDCSNTGYHLVGLEIGDLESRFAVASKAPPSTQQFSVWDATARTLMQAPAEFHAGWHPMACMKPAPEDLAIHDLSLSRKPVRYLLPEHGVIAWGNLDDQGHPEGPSLRTPKKKIPLAISINDISHEVRWLPFRHAYQIESGVHDRAMDPPRDVPLVTMDTDGRLARHAMPAGLTHALDVAGARAPAEMIATQAGDLVIQPGPPANGGGLYLVQGEHSRRVWCTAAPVPGQAGGADGCTMSQDVAVSPDGCRIAFDARPAVAIAGPFPPSPTIKVITLCEPGFENLPPTAAGHKHRKTS